IREARHENLLPFVGASVEHGAVALLYAYCARGSLRDVLANEDLHLDAMFVSSLVADLLKGLIYLHDSDIVSHGNLHSSNCLVDSRWVLQIADFGLHEFKAGGQVEAEAESAAHERRRRLWRAPELLRAPFPPPRGSQKADVYSFGIVLYEIVGQAGPWGDCPLSED
ncbi:Raf homolog serine/threonine-protein kinase Raf, partial [Gryllus bimaculatus]